MKAIKTAAAAACCMVWTFAACWNGMAQTGSVVTINADKVMVINGRKVFPIALSPGPPTLSRTPTGRDALAELAEAGALIIRMAQTTDWNSVVISNQQASLDWAGQHGMYGMVNLRELSEFAAGDTATEAGLRAMVNRFKQHPALGLWKNKDEAWWGDVSAEDLQRGYEVIREEDPNHPVEQTHAPRGTVEELRPYNAAADILAIDIYPVSVPPGTHSLLPNKEISMVGDWTQFLADVAQGQKQYWMIEQIAWSGVTPPARTLVFPTFRQSRYMAYQAIINGARGLMFFGGNVASTLNAQDAPLGWNWTFWDEVLRRVVREVGDHSVLAGALVAPESALPIAMSGPVAPDVEFCVREVPPYIYLLASKREGATTNVTFGGLPAWASVGEVLYESGRAVAVQNGEFTDTFAPFDVHVYRFAQAPQSPTIIYPPQSRTNHPGIAANLYVTADGTGPLSYQWRKNGEMIPGAVAPVLSFTPVAASDAGEYDVVVTGAGSVTSAPAVLAVADYQPNQIPSITSPPLSRANFPGTTASFSVATSGNGPFAFQWRKGGTNIPGAISWTLTVSNVLVRDAGEYDVVVRGFTSVTSAAAMLTVMTPPGNETILYEPFDYANIGGPASSNAPLNWAYGGTGANDLSLVSGSLAHTGLVASVGNSVTNGGVGLGVRRLMGSNVNSGVVYFSALFRINDLGFGIWNGAASQVGALTAPDNASFRGQLMIRLNSPSGYAIGVQKGGTGATATFASGERRAGETVFLAGKYDFTVSPNVASLWVNPNVSTFGAEAEPGGAVSASTGVDGFSIDRFNFRQNTVASVPAAIQWDELRVGASWASVTPPPPPRLVDVSLSNGLLQFAYTNFSGRIYTVFGSTNLLDWEPVGAAEQISPGHYRFTEAAGDSARRFYQLR